MASPENQHCANCIGTLAFSVIASRNLARESRNYSQRPHRGTYFKFLKTTFLHTGWHNKSFFIKMGQNPIFWIE